MAKKNVVPVFIEIEGLDAEMEKVRLLQGELEKAKSLADDLALALKKLSPNS